MVGKIAFFVGVLAMVGIARGLSTGQIELSALEGSIFLIGSCGLLVSGYMQLR